MIWLQTPAVLMALETIDDRTWHILEDQLLMLLHPVLLVLRKDL